MRYIHHTPERINKFTFNIQQSVTMKPKGIWFAPEGQWAATCHSIGSPDYIGEYMLEVEIDITKLIVLRTISDANDFFAKYGTSPDTTGYNPCHIHWDRVSQDYSGYYVTNDLFWKLRLQSGFTWIYALDLGSGCIWDKRGFKKVTRVNY